MSTICALCNCAYDGHGNACAPLGTADDHCCDDCNVSRVIPARMSTIQRDAKRCRNAAALRPASATQTPHNSGDDDDYDDDKDDDSAQKRVGKRKKSEPVPEPIPEPVLQAGLTALSVDSTDLALAVAPALVATPPVLPPRDLVVLLDVTYSMERDGITGLKTIMINLDKLITQLLNQEGIAPERHGAYRSSLNILFLWFGSVAGPFEGNLAHAQEETEDSTLETLFTSASSDSLVAEVGRIEKDLACSQGYTNIEAAISYACDALADRFDRYRDADRANGVLLTGSILLVTDGSPNIGEYRAETIVHRHVGLSRVTPDSTPSGMAGNGPTPDHPFRQPVSVFAIGLGNSMAPEFLTALTQDTGFWCFVSDPTDPTTAFKKTFGVVLTSVAPKVVKIECVAHRGDDVIVDTRTTTHYNLGLVPNTKPLEPFLVHGVLPHGLAVGDVVRCTVTVPGLEYSATAEIPVRDAAVNVGGPGLFVRTEEVERSMRELRKALHDPHVNGYEAVRASFSHNPVALTRIDATMDLVAQSMRLPDRQALLNPPPHPFSTFAADPLSYYGSTAATMYAPSFHHSFEASFSQAGL